MPFFNFSLFYFLFVLNDLFSKPINEAIEEQGFTNFTPAQEKAIPSIKEGKNLLLIAPTGYGKTEAALLPIFDELIKEKTKGIKVLYITPLRALNRDLLDRMESWCRKLDLTLGVRHGDTDQRERSKQASLPPEILITTPETLQAIIVGRVMRSHLRNVRWVVVDEVHELVDNKRGAQLSIALERLREIAKFQIIGLSATIGSPEKVARFLVGNRNKGNRNKGNRNKETKCEIAIVSIAKDMEINVFYPQEEKEDRELAEKLYTYPQVAARLRKIKEIIDSHKSVIVFTNTRAIAEVLTSRFKVWGVENVGIHHGSLSKPTRLLLEKNLKTGRIKGAISTSSLELGIDVGQLDCIIQYSSPREVTRTLQRIGRSGHAVEKKAKGCIIVQDPDDFFESVVIAKRALEEKLEEIGIPDRPYDVLMHQIAGLLLERRRWSFDDALEIIRNAYPFQHLTEEEFVEVLEYMYSVYPRFVWYSREERVFARARVRERLYNYYFRNLSMIPEEKHYSVIESKDRMGVGLLDEGFVLEYGEVGKKFIEGGVVWCVEQITGERIYVKRAEDPFGAIPSWAGEEIPVPFEVAQEVGALRSRVEAEGRKSRKETLEKLQERYPFDPGSMETALKPLVEHALSYPMPTHDRILIERWKEYTIVHSALGTKQNRSLSLILGEEFGGGESITTSVDPYRIILKTQAPFEKVKKVIEKRCEKSLKRTVTRTGIFKKNFLNVLRKCGGVEKGADLSKIGIEKIIKSYEGSVVWKEAMKTTMFKDFEPISKKEFEIVGVDGLTPLGKIALENLSRKYDIIKPERMKKLIVEYTKARLLDEAFTFICCDCYSYVETLKIKNVKGVVCPECGSKRIGFLKESEEKVERGLFRGKREELKKEANENCDLLQEHGLPFLLVMAARMKKERALKLLKSTKKIDLLIPLIINEERKELRRRFG